MNPIGRTVLTTLLYLWVLPNTVIGIIMGAACGWDVRISGRTLEFHGLPVWFIFPAITMGHTILYKQRADAATWRQHELVHVRQYELFGPLFLPAYCLASAINLMLGLSPYYDNPFEIQAYREVKNPGRLPR